MIFGIYPTSALPLASDEWAAPEQIRLVAAADGLTLTAKLSELGITYPLYCTLNLASVVRLMTSYFIAENIILSSITPAQPIYPVIELFETSDQSSASTSALLTAGSNLTVVSLIISISNALAETGFDLSDESTHTIERLLLAAEILSVTTGAASAAELAALLADTFVVRDALAWVAALSADETVAVSEQLTAAIQARLTAPETLALQSALASSLVVVASDSIELSESANPVIELLLRAETMLAFIGSLPLDDGDYQAWVMNADTTGVTTYSNFPMDSLWTHTDGKPYGLTSTGIYRLEGADDDGEPISAMVATGDLDFDSSREKNVPRCYLYITQGGDAILKTITSIRGSRHETYYELADRVSDGDDDLSYRRVPLGRGVRGIWWRFEIHNVDGSDFDLDGAEVLPVVLSRRG